MNIHSPKEPTASHTFPRNPCLPSSGDVSDVNRRCNTLPSLSKAGTDLKKNPFWGFKINLEVRTCTRGTVPTLNVDGVKAKESQKKNKSNKLLFIMKPGRTMVMVEFQLQDECYSEHLFRIQKECYRSFPGAKTTKTKIDIKKDIWASS